MPVLHCFWTAQLRSYDLPTALTLHHHVHVNVADTESFPALLDFIVLRAVDDSHVVAQQTNSTARRDHRDIADRSRPKIVDHIWFGEGFAGLVVLDVVIREYARQFREVGGDQGAVAVFEES